MIHINDDNNGDILHMNNGNKGSMMEEMVEKYLRKWRNLINKGLFKYT
jgi:hypothetical protein